MLHRTIGLYGVYGALFIATGCASKSTAGTPAAQQGHATDTVAHVAASFASDTAFVEISRVERHGTPTPEGGCRFFIPHASSGITIPAGAVYVERPVASGRMKCTYLVARGYRRVMPPLDTAGTASVSASVDVDSGVLATMRARRRP